MKMNSRTGNNTITRKGARQRNMGGYLDGYLLGCEDAINFLRMQISKYSPQVRVRATCGFAL